MNKLTKLGLSWLLVVSFITSSIVYAQCGKGRKRTCGTTTPVVVPAPVPAPCSTSCSFPTQYGIFHTKFLDGHEGWSWGFVNGDGYIHVVKEVADPFKEKETVTEDVEEWIKKVEEWIHKHRHKKHAQVKEEKSVESKPVMEKKLTTESKEKAAQ